MIDIPSAGGNSYPDLLQRVGFPLLADATAPSYSDYLPNFEFATAGL